MLQSSTALRLYGMQERADHLDFDVRLEGARDVLAKPHRHEYFQIQVAIEGGTQQFIGSAVRPFGTGYLSFVQPFRTHVVPHPPGSRYAIVNFDQRFLWPDLDIAAAGALDASAVDREPTLAPFVFQEQIDFHFEPPEFARVQGWLDELLVLNKDRRFGGEAAIRGILLQLLGWVCRRHGEQLQGLRQAAGNTLPQDALQRAMRHLREHLFDEDLSLQDIAGAASLSASHFAHLLKKQTGRTFTELVTERRLDAAKELLLTSTLRINDVAQRCGFADGSYFTRQFRRYAGTTPREFREAAKRLA